MIRLWPLAAALVLAVLCGGTGYRVGYGASEAKHQAELLVRIEAGQKLEAARRVLAVQRDELSRKLEEQAYADPVVVTQCFSPDRVRRLNALR